MIKRIRTHREKQDAAMAAYWRAAEREWRRQWLIEHPGRTAAEYNVLLRDQDSEVWQWRRAKGQANRP
jgi:TfoX/Sxy family transcriptional regulator of competence genes